MSRVTRTITIFAAGAALGSVLGIAVWLVTGLQAVWFGLLLDLAAWFVVAGVVDWRQRYRARRLYRCTALAMYEAMKNAEPIPFKDFG